MLHPSSANPALTALNFHNTAWLGADGVSSLCYRLDAKANPMAKQHAALVCEGRSLVLLLYQEENHTKSTRWTQNEYLKAFLHDRTGSFQPRQGSDLPHPDVAMHCPVKADAKTRDLLG